jgi:ABC-2 type transport system ATP-binding protein
MSVETRQIVVSTKNLTRRFGSFTAVDAISLSVYQGEIFGFLGANGAGKTTAIRMLCGLLLPTSGEGAVLSFDINRDTEKIKRAIGYMSQKFSLYPDLTGRENMSFYADAYGLDKSYRERRVSEISAQLELSGFLDEPCGKLPLGWRQRLALGVSLLHEPKLLFLDEPTAGVDPEFRRRFWTLLYGLSDSGTTIFVTTHYMDEAEYCHRISIMDQGKIVTIGNPQELKRTHAQTSLDDLFISLVRRDEQKMDVR